MTLPREVGTGEESVPTEQQPEVPEVLQEVQNKQEEESLKWQAVWSPLRLCPLPAVYGSSWRGRCAAAPGMCGRDVRLSLQQCWSTGRCPYIPMPGPVRAEGPSEALLGEHTQHPWSSEMVWEAEA